jgi:hypothetical protein
MFVVYFVVRPGPPRIEQLEMKHVDLRQETMYSAVAARALSAAR